MSELTVIVLAAGGGTRMKSKTAKVLHPVAGRSMLAHVLGTVSSLGPDRVVTVVGHQREQVAAEAQRVLPDGLIATQEVLDGTGGAVRCALQSFPDSGSEGTVVVLTADAPLLRPKTLQAFLADHDAAQQAASVLTGVVEDPTGYGRIVRDDSGDVAGIVEHKDATRAQRDIIEINSGILAFDAAFLTQAIERLGTNNNQGEYYLTDTLGIAEGDGLTVGAFQVDDITEIAAANDRVQLAELGRMLNERILTGWMREGVTVIDPGTTWIDESVELEADTTLLPGTQLHGATHVSTGAVIGPDTTLDSCVVGPHARVIRSHGVQAQIGASAMVGPFAYLRPGTALGGEGKIGAFVETKNAIIGRSAKVPHLSYVGDAEIGEGTNIGAGTIFANYDGVEKHRTRIGRHVRTASNNTFVAPISIGDGAGTGAGAVIRSDVPPGGLGLSAGPQRVIERWAQTDRAGSAQAQAAEEAEQQASAGAEDQTESQDADHA